MVPGQDGSQTLAELRTFSQAPVIMLTARGKEYDKLLGFRLWADDYVPKPFSPKELMARVHAVLKRASGPRRTRLTFGALTIEPEAQAVTLEDSPGSQPPRSSTRCSPWLKTSEWSFPWSTWAPSAGLSRLSGGRLQI